MAFENIANREVSMQKPSALHPLTKVQSGIWLAQMIDPASSAYNIGEYLEISGDVRQSVLVSAIQYAVQQSDTLQIRFVEEYGEPKQYFEKDADVDVACIDLRCEPSSRVAAESWMQQNIRRARDLRKPDPLYRIAILRLSDECFFLYHSYHHIIFDGTSKAIFLQSVEAIYTALVSGCPQDIGGNESWADVLEDDLTYRVSPRFKQSQKYWLEKFSDKPSQVSLSGNRSSIPARTFIRVADTLPSYTLERLKSFGQELGGSLAQVLTAAVSIYMFRFSGETDVVLGTPISTRSGARLRRVQGMGTTVLPLRVTLDPDWSFGECLARVAKSMRESFRHRRYTGDDLRGDLRLLPDDSGFYGTIVNFMSFGYVSEFCGKPARLHSISNGPVFDISVNFYEERNVSNLRMEIDGNSGHYDLDTLQRHLKRFMLFLSRLPAPGKDTSIASIDLLLEDERVRLFGDVGLVPYRSDRCVHELFAEQAELCPEALAVSCGDDQLSYGELDRRANRLAHHLIAQGVGPEVVVGVCLERGPDLITALLAVLKAGGAYLPLDPAYPATRLGLMLSDADAAVLLTQSQHLDRLPGFGRLICLDQALPEADDLPTTAPPRRAAPENLAYVIFTSGSTGRPKGTAIEHRNLMNLVDWHCRNYGVTAADRATQVAGPGFDASVWELWPYMVSGASVHVVPPDVRMDPARLASWLVSEAIDMSLLPTLLAEAVIVEPWPSETRLRTLLTGGDTLRRWPSRELPFLLVNHYGPTEYTVVATAGAQPLAGGPKGASQDIPHIGRPVSNTRVYLLDAQGMAVPTGAVGELYIAGAGVARGYLKRADLTAERFLPDPFVAGARMYRTGDLGRYRADGAIDFLGRSDAQVKIRGFRIEPGEIEAVLNRHAAVQTCAVQPVAHGGDMRLVAYVVTPSALDAAATQELISDLRAHLRTDLPEHMIPAAFVTLEALPLTPNGKLDRAALPEPNFSGWAKDHVAPRSPTEKLVIEIWQGLLKIDRIGVHDNFFDLGGHSLLAAKFVSQLHDRTGVDAPLPYIFENPTPAGFIERLRNQHFSETHKNVSTGKAKNTKPDPLALSLDAIIKKQQTHLKSWEGKRFSQSSLIVTRNETGTQKSLFWCFQGYEELRSLSQELGPDRPLHGLRSGYMVMKYSESNVHRLAARYAEEIIELQPDGDLLLGGNCQASVIAYAIALRLKEMGRGVGMLYMMESEQFPPYDGPIAFLFGRDSYLNPYRPGEDPDAKYHSIYGNNYTVDFIDGAHGQFFKPQNIPSLGNAIRKHL